MSTYVAVFALVLAYVATVAAFMALRTLAKVRASGAIARASARPAAAPTQAQAPAHVTAQVPQSLIDATNRNTQISGTLAAELETLRAEVESSSQAIAKLAERKDETAGALRNIALVRYDAFGEMSGRMSFSLALLNEGGDGVIVSAIAGREDTSVYAKGVTNGQGEHDLSPEEQQAVSTALHRPRTGLLGRRAS